MSVRDADSIRDRENKIVFASEWAARGQSHAQKLIGAAIDFEQFAGAAVDLLANGGAKFYFVDLAFAVRAEANRFGTKRKDRGAVSFFQWPAQDAAGGDAAANFTAEQIGLADELRCVGRGGVRVDFARRSDLLERAIAEQRDAVGESHGFFLVVRDEKKGDADFALKRFQFTLHLLAQIGIERGERFVEKQKLRAIHEGAGQSHALLLASAKARGTRASEFRHFHHVQGFVDAPGNFVLWRTLHAQAVRDVVSHVQVREQRVVLKNGVYAALVGRAACRAVRRTSRFRRRWVVRNRR